MPVIGVAVAIPEPWATEFVDYRLRIGDPTAEGVPSHITLIPPTEVDGDLAAIEAHLAVAATEVAPFRVHLRDPSFHQLQALPALCEGGMIADVVVNIATIDPVLGGVDR